MKQFKSALLAMLCIVSFSMINAQDKENPWMLSVSANAIDISTASDENSGYFGSFGYDGNNLNVMPWASKFSVGRYLNKGFIVELSSSFNKVDAPWSNNDNNTFASVDLNLKYDLNHVFGESGWFDPFLYAGIGENWIGAENGLSPNFGGGFNAWFGKHLGLNFTSGYKKVNTPTDFKMFQHSIGLTWKFGYSDTDGDGVRDKDDKCPQVAGIAELEGCPDTDADDDGVEDYCDACPQTPGLKEFNGCPDTDGDGVPDIKDECPEVAGVVELNGCPDADGDGVADKDDACPNVPGPKTNAGCPWKDTDEDGVIDLVDKCVTVKGPASNDGCPERFQEQDAIYESAKGIVFKVGKAKIQPDVALILDDVANILKQNQNLQFNFTVDGHTDSTGSDALNNKLSKDRAQSVKDYLVSQGVAENRLKVVGHGSRNPIESNATKEGRQKNRRVEINEIEK